MCLPKKGNPLKRNTSFDHHNLFLGLDSQFRRLHDTSTHHRIYARNNELEEQRHEEKPLWQVPLGLRPHRPSPNDRRRRWAPSWSVSARLQRRPSRGRPTASRTRTPTPPTRSSRSKNVNGVRKKVSNAKMRLTKGWRSQFIGSRQFRLSNKNSLFR